MSPFCLVLPRAVGELVRRFPNRQATLEHANELRDIALGAAPSILVADATNYPAVDFSRMGIGGGIPPSQADAISSTVDLYCDT